MAKTTVHVEITADPQDLKRLGTYLEAVQALTEEENMVVLSPLG